MRASGVVYIGSLNATMATFLVAYIIGDLAAVEQGWLMSSGNGESHLLISLSVTLQNGQAII